MPGALDQPFFTVSGVSYSGQDLVRATQRWGQWARVEEEVRQGLACVQRADDTGDDVSDRDLESAASEFRYARDLISGEELESWLAAWCLRIEDWTDYLRRSILRRRWAADLPAIVVRYTVDQDAIDDVIEVEVVCSGYLARAAHELAARGAAAARAREERWVIEPPPAGDRDAMLAALDAGFEWFHEHVVTLEALEDQLRAHRLDWTIVEGVSVEFATIQAAREAALCVRSDGMGLDDVARAARTTTQNVRRYLEDIEPDHRSHFVSARPGELLGPLTSPDGFRLVLVRDKVPPSLDESGVRRRAEERILRISLEGEVRNWVKWHRRM